MFIQRSGVPQRFALLHNRIRIRYYSPGVRQGAGVGPRLEHNALPVTLPTVQKDPMSKLATRKPTVSKPDADGVEAQTNGDVQTIPMNKIVVDYRDNRSRIPSGATDEEIAKILADKELNRSIAIHGLLQAPIGVRQDDGTVKIVAGFRRMYAVEKSLKWKSVKVNVMSGEAWQLQLTENNGRRNASPWLAAQVAMEGYDRLVKQGKLDPKDAGSVKRLAAMIGCSDRAAGLALEFRGAPKRIHELGVKGWSLDALRAIGTTEADKGIVWPKDITIGAIADNAGEDPTPAEVTAAKTKVLTLAAGLTPKAEGEGQTDGAGAKKPIVWQPKESKTEKYNDLIAQLNKNGLTQAQMSEFITQLGAELAELGTNLDRAVLAMHKDGSVASRSYYAAGLLMGVSLCQQADKNSTGYGAPIGPFDPDTAPTLRGHAAHRQVLLELVNAFTQDESVQNTLDQADRKAKNKNASGDKITQTLAEYAIRGDATVKGLLKLQAESIDAVLNPKPVKAPKAPKTEGKTLPKPKAQKAVKATDEGDDE